MNAGRITFLKGFIRLKWKFQGKYYHQKELLGGTDYQQLQDLEEEEDHKEK